MKKVLEFDTVSAEIDDGGRALITELCNTEEGFQTDLKEKRNA